MSGAVNASGNADKEHVIHIQVDGDPEQATQAVMTAVEIISTFTEHDPNQTYLVMIHGNNKVSYKDTPNQPIELKNGMRFQTVSLGPTPVSDGSGLVGVAAFIAGLKDLGHEPRSLPGKTDHVYFDYTVESGSKAGTQVRLGFIVPDDFPVTTPSGPHVSPRVFPIKTDGQHPHGAIHTSQAEPFESGAGGEWQYWSRPVRDWGARRKSVASYMSYIWSLWHTQ